MRTGDKDGTGYDKAFKEHSRTLDKFKALRERFEGQRNRATALRDGVSPDNQAHSSVVDTLSKAIQCECRR